MFQRIVSLMLACVLIVSLAGCGAAPEAETTAAAVQTEAAAAETTEVITEPTLSAEEILIASLPEKVRQAYDEGIVALSMLEDLTRTAATDEVAAIVQNIYGLHFGGESVVMNQVTASEFSGMETTRHWMVLLMYLAIAEHFCPTTWDNFADSAEGYIYSPLMDGDKNREQYFWAGMYQVFENPGKDHFAKWFEKDAILSASFDWGYMADYTESCEPFWTKEDRRKAEEEGWVKWLDYGLGLTWTNGCADRITGEKILPYEVGEPFGYRETMTVQEVVETALRFHHFLYPEPEMYDYADVPACDPAIITEELLNRETTLPEASCAVLPKEWRGVTVRNLIATAESDAVADMLIQENEIQVIKDAGFNYVNVLFDFEYLVSSSLSPYYWNAPDAKQGQMNENKLKELDQIIAWCMERDIHVNLSCDGVAGWSKQATPPAIFANTKNAVPMAQQWAVLARRYADIPNTYLSFTLCHSPEIPQEHHYNAFFPSVVEAIRAESPDRCLIAKVNAKYFPKAIAELGVAISTNVEWPEGFFIDPQMKANTRNQIFETAAWPYEKNGQTHDAESAMTNRRYGFLPVDAMKEQADAYGVGFLVSRWAPESHWATSVYRERYSDETMERYLTDFASVLESREIGWCYGDMSGFVGIASAYPMVNSTTYTQVDNAPLYIDDEIFGWFQTINQVQ